MAYANVCVSTRYISSMRNEIYQQLWLMQKNNMPPSSQMSLSNEHRHLNNKIEIKHGSNSFTFYHTTYHHEKYVSVKEETFQKKKHAR